MPWKFVCNLRFEVLQTTTIRKITKENEEIETVFWLYFSIFFRYLHDGGCL